MSFLAHRFVRVTVTFLVLSTPAVAWTQAHEQQSGPYTLRASTVGTESISAATAEAHGIERSPTHALFNATVLQNGKTVPAQVTVEARNLAGMRSNIAMQQTSANGYVSYTGVYDIVRGEVLDFTVMAQPEGSAKTLTLKFRDRMWGGSGQ